MNTGILTVAGTLVRMVVMFLHQKTNLLLVIMIVIHNLCSMCNGISLSEHLKYTYTFYQHATNSDHNLPISLVIIQPVNG